MEKKDDRKNSKIRVLPFDIRQFQYGKLPTVEIDESNPEESIQSKVSIDDLKLPEVLSSRMFQHQVEGVLWLYNLHNKYPGGILGDDMGLGKTFQVTCLLASLFRKSEIIRTLIIAPVSVLSSWLRELNEFLLPYVKNIKIELLSSEVPKNRRQSILRYNILILYINSDNILLYFIIYDC